MRRLALAAVLALATSSPAATQQRPDGHRFFGEIKTGGKWGKLRSVRHAVNRAKARGGAELRVRRLFVFGARGTVYTEQSSGGTTACGQQMDNDVSAVAHRTLPCGTRIEIRRNGKRVRAFVWDRGPAEWTGNNLDLTPRAWDAVAYGETGPREFVVVVLSR